MKKVFLGGTCNSSTWRDKLIPLLDIDSFNPVVEDWISEHQTEEKQQRIDCDYCLYVITPKMTGVYSIAEVVDDSNKQPGETIFCFLLFDEEDEFSDSQIKSLMAVGGMVEWNGAKWCTSLQEIARYLNEQEKE